MKAWLFMFYKLLFYVPPFRSQQFHRIERVHPPGYTALTAVRGTAIKETRCSSQYNSFILNNTYIDSAIKNCKDIYNGNTKILQEILQVNLKTLVQTARVLEFLIICCYL